MTQSQHVHVVGVAGVGMSAVAGILAALGYRVTGSDRFLDQGESLDVLQRLKAGGVELTKQDGSAITSDTKAVVVSTAIEAGNPELEAATRHGVEVVHRAEMLARLARGHRCIAITGTAGKTTVTGMTGWILAEAGLDPTVINGGAVLNWVTDRTVGNVRHGQSDLWVLEADESDRSLLRFHPDIALITNVSKDHFELDEVVRLFGSFVQQVSGPVLGGRGVAQTLGARITEVTITVVHDEEGWCVDLGSQRARVNLPGRHNAENAAMAAALSRSCGVDDATIARALTSFRGIQRRLELAGDVGGVRVYDDYAHNPAKIHASWCAVAESARRVFGVWRPHGYGPLSLMRDELVAALASACRKEDRCFILPVYYAGGTASKSITSEDFVTLLVLRGVPATYVPDYESLEQLLVSALRAGDAVVGMGARDPQLPRFAQSLVSRLRT